MDVNFAAALAALPSGTVFRIANQARPAANYVFGQVLPERPDYSYQAQSGTMTIRATMAGMAGMDSPYAETGAIEITTFSEGTAKVANIVRLPEAALRKLQNILRDLLISQQPTIETIQTTALNFVDKLIVQSHLDTAEWLRGQVFTTGAIDWTFNKKRLQVSYGVPSGNILPLRTLVGNTAYGGSASVFWSDVRTIRRLLKGNVRAIFMHPDTIDAARYNTVNSMVTINEGAGSITFRRVNSNQQFTDDAGDTVQIVSYGLEGELPDLANPGQTLKVPFLSRGAMVGVANNEGTDFVVGAGSTDTPENALGFTHIAPTTEGGGTPGRWADVYTPENEPWSLVGRGVTNLLPVLEAPDKIVIATTELA